MCRSRCSGREHQAGEWICNVCRKESESWFTGILGAIQPSFKKGMAIIYSRSCKICLKLNFCLGVHLRTKMSNDRLEEIDEDLEKLRKKEKEHVRDFIERLVSTMLGGDVDDTCVTKLYNDSHCKQNIFYYIFERNIIFKPYYSSRSTNAFKNKKYSVILFLSSKLLILIQWVAYFLQMKQCFANITQT